MEISRKLRIFSLVFSIFLLAVAANAQDGSEEEEKIPWQFSGVTGRAESSSYGYFQSFSDFPNYQERLDFEIEAGVTDYTYGAKLVPWIWARVPEARAGAKQSARAYFDLKEGWVERTSPEWDIRVGNQIISWGAADQINPTDVWNSRDMYDPFASYKIPQGTFQFKLHPAEVDWLNVEFLFSPFFRPNRLPLAFPDEGYADISRGDSRTLVIMPNKVSTGLFVAPLQYRLVEPSYPQTWQTGTRIQFLRFGGWDFSFTGFTGVEKNPRMAFSRKGNPADSALPLVVTVYPSYHRMYLGGFDISGSITLDKQVFGLRFEGAYVIRDNSRAENQPENFKQDLVKDDYVQMVLGVDHTVQKKVLDTVLYINSMFVYYQRTTNLENPPGRLLVQGLPSVDPWDRNFILYLEDRITPALKATSTLLTSLRNLDGWWTPAIAYQLTDNLKASLGVDWFFTTNLNGFYGQFSDNRRANLKVSFAF
ncbi:MAG: hypothetical protein AB7F43_14060 [Bacteriovoracia bacterium]